MLLGIDHLVIACADPDAAALELERAVGLRAVGGGRHEALGTFNRLVWLGDTYLELIGIFDRALAERSWIGAPTVRALDAGGGLATWAVATDAIEADVERLRATGSTVASPSAGERLRPDGGVVRWRLAAPPLLGREEPPFLIEHDLDGAEWSPTERASRAADAHPVGGPVRLETLEIAVADPGATGLRLVRAVGVGPFRPSLTGGGARDASLGAQTVRLRPTGRMAGTTEPIVTIRLRVETPGADTRAAGPPVAARSVSSLGCRFVLRGTAG
jgi:hypothetical protein